MDGFCLAPPSQQEVHEMRSRVLAALTLWLILSAATATAGRTVTLTRAGDVDPNLMVLGETRRQACQVGNLNPMAWLIGDWISGNEGYKYHFFPRPQCPCPVGFHLEMVYIKLNFGPEDVPSVFDVYVDLEEAVWNDLAGCWYPGPEVCTSEVHTVQIDTAGVWDIGIPIGDQCPCASKHYQYLLSFHIVTQFPPTQRPDATSDEFPVGCTSWNDLGFGWMDVVQEFGWPGEILIWGDVECCELPVQSETDSWGTVKSLYR
jgi:hypothetical protein